MSGHFKKVQSGDPLVIPASAYNAFVDAAEAHRRSRRVLRQPPTDDRRPAEVVLVRNSSGSDVGRFGILGIDGVVIGPDINEAEFASHWALDGDTPTASDHRGRFVVTLEPIATGKIGRATVRGVVPVNLSLTNDTDRFADVKDSDATQLQSCAWGSAEILWVDSAGTSGLGLVRLGSMPIGLFPVRVWKDGGAIGSKTAPCTATYTVRTTDATGPATGGIALGTALTPQRRRPNPGKMDCPSDSGSGEIGQGFYAADGTFCLWDANETLSTKACTT